MNGTNCGDANPKGNVSLFYKGSCGKFVSFEDCYRCTGCGGRFHKDCILKHFELEKEHDFGRIEQKNKIIRIGAEERARLQAEELDWTEQTKGFENGIVWYQKQISKII